VRSTDPFRLFDSAADEANDAHEAFGLEESGACQELRKPAWMKDGIRSGRLTRIGGGSVRRVARRLALRGSYVNTYVVMRQPATGRTMRLPFA
jgi:hypothetical protein